MTLVPVRFVIVDATPASDITPGLVAVASAIHELNGLKRTPRAYVEARVRFGDSGVELRLWDEPMTLRPTAREEP